jgi:hypothetical protein
MKKVAWCVGALLFAFAAGAQTDVPLLWSMRTTRSDRRTTSS